MANITKKLDSFKIDGIGLVLYAIAAVLFVLVLRLKVLPPNMLGALFTMLILGNVFYYLGANLPLFRSYLGGGAVFVLFGCSILSLTKVIPTSAIKTVDAFVTTTDFVDFFIVSLIVGAILGMNREMLLKASIRFLPVAFTSMAIAFLVTTGMSQLIGKGFRYGAYYVAFPVMGGGIGAGAIPLSQIYHNALGGSSATYLSNLLPAVILGNVLAIIGGSILSKVTDHSKWNGHGVIIQGFKEEEKKEKLEITFQKIGVGLLVALSFFMLASILNALVPKINKYAFLILLVIIFKGTGWIPKYYEDATITFSRSVTKNMTHALLAGVGMTKLDLVVLSHSLTWQFVLLVLTSLITISIAAGILGRIFGLYPVESAITAGMVNNSMGGAGNISVLAACNRLNLIGFAQMGNRLGGAIMLVVAGLFVSFFGK